MLVMALALMGGGIMCRPMNLGLGDFAFGKGGLGPGGHFEYGLDFINRICETAGAGPPSFALPSRQLVRTRAYIQLKRLKRHA